MGLDLKLLKRLKFFSFRNVYLSLRKKIFYVLFYIKELWQFSIKLFSDFTYLYPFQRYERLYSGTISYHALIAYLKMSLSILSKYFFIQCSWIYCIKLILD